MQDRPANVRARNTLHWFTRFSFLPLVFVTGIFGPLLVLRPGSTEDYWSWPIRPDLSAVWVGAGYTFGAVAISTMLIRGRWTEAIVPILSTWPFAVAMLLATIVHNDRFFTDTSRYYVWLAIYLYLPLALPVMFLVNRGSDPDVNPKDKRLPVWLRRLLTSVGALTGAYGLLLVVGATDVVETWAWPLTPLMAKVIGGWLLFIATGAMLTAVEGRYAAYRYYFPISAFWFALLLVASIANSDDLETGPGGPLYLAAVTVAGLGSLAIFLYMERASEPAIASGRGSPAVTP
jgi:hypothetical protein